MGGLRQKGERGEGANKARNILYYIQYTLYTGWTRVDTQLGQGEAILNFFSILKMGTMLPIRFKVQFQNNQQIWPRMRGKVFTFKNHRGLKDQYFHENLRIPSFYFKNNCQKENSKLKFD